MDYARAFALVFALTAVGCGGGGGESGPTVAGAVKVLNGPTSIGVTSSARAAISVGLPDGTYRLSPSRMTFSITGVGLVPAGASGSDVHVKIHSLSDCTASYDRSQGSLAVMTDCAVEAPTGSFGGIVLQYDPTYTVVMDDSEAGIYSDPSAPGGLTTTLPAGGAKPIQVTDQNQVTLPGQIVTYFTTPLTIAEGSTPQLYVVFDPTHWMVATLSGGSFAAGAPRMSGNPPIVPAASAFGKAALYTNIGTTMSYRSDGCSGNSCESLLFLYGDATTPVSVTWQDHDICTPMGGSPVVAFNGNGTLWGTCGMLGLDAQENLAWVSPAGFSSSSGAVTGYTGVYSMPALSSLGETTSLAYKCTTTVPQPAAGTNYSSGAPAFTPDGTLSLTLLAN
jgi:hypothetical protein